jgi:hypothetical protein
LFAPKSWPPTPCALLAAPPLPGSLLFNLFLGGHGPGLCGSNLAKINHFLLFVSCRLVKLSPQTGSAHCT